jgi:hypothetical protein
MRQGANGTNSSQHNTAFDIDLAGGWVGQKKNK